MHRGKCCDNTSIEAALTCAPGRLLSESDSVESGVTKFLDRWLRMGVRRSSSSRRGRARAARYSVVRELDLAYELRVLNTSKPLSRLISKLAVTMLICSRAGTYALPAFISTRRPSTSSGTVSKSTLNQPPSSTSCLFKPGVAFSKSVASALLSLSGTISQSKFKDSMKACLSRASSLWNRNLKSADSIRANRLRRSSVEENARRRIKCE